MQYKLIIGYNIISGPNVSNEESEIRFENESSKFILTRDPDSYLKPAEIDLAIGITYLKWVFNGISTTIDIETDEIKKERKRKTGSQTVLIQESIGSLDINLEENEIKLFEDRFYIIEKGYDKFSIIKKHRPEFDALLVAFGMESSNPMHWSPFITSVMLLHEDGRPIYNKSTSGSGELAVSFNITNDLEERIRTRWENLIRLSTLQTVMKLYSLTRDKRTDKLQTFIFGWTALEIVIQKLFLIHENASISDAEFTQKISDQKGKYTLIDKFFVVTHLLIPQSPNQQLRESFSRIKDLRDKLIHHGEIPSSNPIIEIVDMVKLFVDKGYL
jgi:hypothetical protein